MRCLPCWYGHSSGEMALDHLLCRVLTSMPGIAGRTAAAIIAEISGKSFASAAALALYAETPRGHFVFFMHGVVATMQVTK